MLQDRPLAAQQSSGHRCRAQPAGESAGRTNRRPEPGQSATVVAEGSRRAAAGPADSDRQGNDLHVDHDWLPRSDLQLSSHPFALARQSQRGQDQVVDHENGSNHLPDTASARTGRHTALHVLWQQWPGTDAFLCIEMTSGRDRLPTQQ